MSYIFPKCDGFNWYHEIDSNDCEKKDISVFSDGRQTRTYCHIKDAIDMIILVIFLGKSFIYNIGYDQEEISAISLARMIDSLVPLSAAEKITSAPKACNS